jgi:tetratricopeptide (TPR) repeat protein
MSFLSGLFGSSKKRLPPDKIYAEYPPGIRYVLLSRFDDKTSQADYMKDVVPYHREASRIEAIIVGRNAKGMELEKAGHMDEAIALYEQNIADRADTPHPYERLRIIYTKHKQYDDAIRVCKAYVEMSSQLAEAIAQVLGDRKLAKQLGDSSGFSEWIQKLEQKKEGATA